MTSSHNIQFTSFTRDGQQMWALAAGGHGTYVVSMTTAMTGMQCLGNWTREELMDAVAGHCYGMEPGIAETRDYMADLNWLELVIIWLESGNYPAEIDNSLQVPRPGSEY